MEKKMNDFFIHIGPWVANALFMVGAYGLANKKLYGFTTQAIANVLYIIQAYMMINWPLFWLSVVLGLFNVYGIYKWSRKEKVQFNDAEKAYAEAVCDLYDDLSYNYDTDKFDDKGVCLKCKTQGKLAPSIGWYCINKKCGGF